jgi:hypothetical protein
MDENPVDLSDYYTKTETEELIPSIDGLATVSYVDEKFSSVEVDVDLTDYALKSEIPDVSQYQTATQVAAAITDALGDIELTNYYTKSEIDDLLANMPAGDIPSGEEVEF